MQLALFCLSRTILVLLGQSGTWCVSSAHQHLPFVVIDDCSSATYLTEFCVMTDDITFSEMSAYGSVSWAAHRLGMSKSQFLRKRNLLEDEGFPRKDAVTGGFHKGDVDAWIDRRRRIADAKVVAFPEAKQRTEVKLDAL